MFKIFSKGKVSKSLIEKYNQKNTKNNLESNLSYLKKISKPVVKYDIIKEALEKTSSRRTNQDKTKKEESTVFTDEDFKSFAKTYFNK